MDRFDNSRADAIFAAVGATNSEIARLRDALKCIRDACGDFENSPHVSEEARAGFVGIRFVAQGALKIT